MWLTDLEKAIAKLREERVDFNFICVDKITPAWDGGIVFKTTRPEITGNWVQIRCCH